MHDAPIPSLAAKLRGGPLFAAWVVAPEPAVIEALLREDFGGAVLDMQHGGFDIAKAAAGVASCALFGKPALVRVPVGDFATASRMLDAGAGAIIAPMINSAEEARRLVGFTKYPPTGERSWGPGRVTTLSGGLDGPDYLGRANAMQLTIAMIETRAALDNVDAILAVEGIDGVFVGPSDLSIGLSGGTLDPSSAKVDAALDRIAASAERAGKLAGIFCFTGVQAKAMVGRGFGLNTIATDLLLLRAAARSELAAAR